jgi:glutamate racemase
MMKTHKGTLYCLATLTALLAAASCRPAGNPPAGAGADPPADSITVVVTDSGLGGLSVLADLERSLRESGAFARADLIFFNALFNEGGYNSLPSRDDKILIFDRALSAIDRRYDPNVILIACNTLSVIYGDTPFAGETSTPVIGIVEGGVELIAGRLSSDPASRVIMFGTETTIREGAHVAGLGERGFGPERVVAQSCPELAGYIEQDVDGAATALLIDAYVTEALDAAGDDSARTYVSLNCTHYGYALDAWRRSFAGHGVEVAGFLDPNLTMADSILAGGRPGSYPEPEIGVRVVSMVEIPAGTIASIGGCLSRTSPATQKALRDYELHPNLFKR